MSRSVRWGMKFLCHRGNRLKLISLHFGANPPILGLRPKVWKAQTGIWAFLFSACYTTTKDAILAIWGCWPL